MAHGEKIGVESPPVNEPRRFRIGPRLGGGGHGEVFLATMEQGGLPSRQVALKMLTAKGVNDEAAQRLRDEATLLMHLRHPGIVRVHGLVLLQERPCLISEYVQGASLADYLEQGSLPSQRALLEMCQQLVEALVYAHQAKAEDGRPLHLVHRDIKPSNIHLTPSGKVILLDFGIARFEGLTRQTETAQDTLLGSVPYLAPERYDQRGDAGVDIFGLGCCVFEGLVGERFFGEARVRDLGRLAFSPDRYRAHLANRLALLSPDQHLWAPLIRSMLSYDETARVTAVNLLEKLRELQSLVSGSGLRSWVSSHRVHQSGTDSEQQSPLEGQVLIEGAGVGERPLGLHTGPVVRSRPNVTAARTGSGTRSLPPEPVVCDRSDPLPVPESLPVPRVGLHPVVWIMLTLGGLGGMGLLSVVLLWLWMR